MSRRAYLTPNRTAVEFEDELISYSQLNDRSNAFASVLESEGLEKGDRVAVLSENRPEYLGLFFACAKLGLVLAPVSWRLSPEEMAWQLNDSSPSVLFASDEYLEAAKVLFSQRVIELQSEGATGDRPAEPSDRSSFDDPLMILYTSGTTGRPKGAVLTHGNFFWANLNMIVASQFSSDDVSLVFLPMFHIGGWNINTLTVLLKGGKVLLEKSFDSKRALDLIERKHVTWMMGVPATYLFLSQAEGFESRDLSSVRQMVVGGAPMPEALLKTYSDRGIEIVQGYGSTELAPNALLLPMDEAGARQGSAGQPYFFTDTRLMNDEGDLLEPPATGEIVARGPIVMKGYWQREDATADAIKEGWLHTGDVARTDEDGYFYVIDRKTDMIISGGENIYPAEVENALYQHPHIAEAAVFGIPDDRWGEAVHAVIVPKEGSELSGEDVIAHCKGILAKFKTPRSVEITADPLPRTPAGKVRKHDLRVEHWRGRDRNI
ncbi:MAG TPA: long-chain fatty acid--CoA ligase [Actinomycetota bacterium]|nr:long-chain fatty acid--CoA ligase [Actinomycetota bacterium]